MYKTALDLSRVSPIYRERQKYFLTFFAFFSTIAENFKAKFYQRISSSNVRRMVLSTFI